MATAFPFPNKKVQDALNNRRTWDDYYKYRENGSWFRQNFTDIKKRHAGKIVIVHGENIVFSSRDVEKVRERLQSLSSLNRAYIRYVPKQKEILLL